MLALRIERKPCMVFFNLKSHFVDHVLIFQLDPQQMVHWFVVSSYASGSFTEERVKNSVALLQSVPSARYAVLHRFTLLFEEVVRAQLDQMEYQASGIIMDKPCVAILC